MRLVARETTTQTTDLASFSRKGKENDMGAIELYFKFKFIAEILLGGIGITALVIYILMVVKGAKTK